MSGRFDAGLIDVLRHYEEVMAVMLPTLGDGAPADLQPLPADLPKTGRVLQVPILELRTMRTGQSSIATKTAADEHAGHRRPLQAAMEAGLGDALAGARRRLRNVGQGPDPSVELANKICRVARRPPPEGFNYELFLDEQGQKISKSKGNGLSVDEWLTYAPPESLALFMYQKPRAAKRLYFDVIPRAVDDYLALLEKFPAKLRRSSWRIPPGISMMASRRRVGCRWDSAFC